MKAKLVSLAEAARLIPSGSSVAFGGSAFRRQPIAFVREMLRLGTTDIHAVGFAAGLCVDLLAAAGALRSSESVYTGLIQYGWAMNFRRGVEAGRIRPFDFPESVQVARFRAAAQGWTFTPTKTLLGTSLAEVNPEHVKEITCPFTGEKYHAVTPALTDFTVIHGYIGDEYGNVQWPLIRDGDDVDFLIAKAAKRLIVTVERIVPHEQIRRTPTLTYIPHVWVEAIVEVPYGAHPGCCDAFYDEDVEHLEDYVQRARDPKRMEEYLQEYVYGTKDHWEYLERVGGIKRMTKLSVGG